MVYPAAVAKLVACPFCREMFADKEITHCPACGLALAPVSKLPASYEAKLEQDWPEQPEWETLPMTFWRRGRGALVLAAVLGIACFFVPWIHVQVPYTEAFSGVEMARKLPWVWGTLVSWIMLAATALSRRSVVKMRGARVVAAVFCAIPVITAAVLWLLPPTSSRVPLRFVYGVGLQLTAVLGVLALPFAVRLGGPLDHADRGNRRDVSGQG